MIYADYNGTYPLKNSVKEYLKERFEGPFANPNAIHSLGQNINQALEKCREICAEALGAEPEQVIFTSGSSESVSQVFHSINNKEYNSILCSPVEHAVVDNAIFGNGFEREIFSFENFNPVFPESGDFDLACLMLANNESGIIFNLEEFVSWALKYNVPVFSDTTQIIGKIPFHFNQSGIDYAVISGHKLGGLTGTGLLLAKNPETLKPLIYGGGQEKGLRGGTQNYLGIECLALLLSNLNKTIESYKNVEKQKIEFENSLKSKIEGLVVFGDRCKRLPNTTQLAIPGIHGQAIQIELESRDIFVTTSSACSDNYPNAPESLVALGYSEELARGSVRISTNESFTELDYMKIHAALIDSYQTLNRIQV